MQISFSCDTQRLITDVIVDNEDILKDADIDLSRKTSIPASISICRTYCLAWKGQCRNLRVTDSLIPFVGCNTGPGTWILMNDVVVLFEEYSHCDDNMSEVSRSL